jgi:methylmalonyl-CoA mutase N-terminal domain/subunit
VGDALAEKLARFRAKRDRGGAEAALDALEAAARGSQNLVGRIVQAVEAHVTLGEICDRLREVFGVHAPSVTF